MAAFSVRRIKCDEGKPACAKCLNTGRKCDGYQRRGSSSSEIMKIHPGNSMSEVLPLRNPSVEFFGSEQERRCFHFFRNKTVLQLSGFFESDLWNHWVLQACHHEPAIRHAVIALGSLHERFETEDKSVVGSNLDAVQGGFALEQYNHAIRQLIRPTSATKRPAIDVCLIACVLFACFEILRGHCRSALSHITSGVRILSELRANESRQGSPSQYLINSPSPYVPLENLEVLFIRLDTQATHVRDTRPMARREQDKMLEVGFCAEIPSSFSYLEEARNSFEYHWNGCMHFFQDVKERCPIYFGEWAESRRQEFEFTLRKWSSAFEGFLLLAKENLDNKGLQGANILRIRYIISRIRLELETLIASENEMVWDKHCAAFSEILSLAESTMILNSNQGDAAFNQKPGFALDMGFVGPLAAVACKCRHPTIRRRASTFLGSMPRQEGIWNSIVSAHVCKRIIEIEESGLSKIARCEDVPNWARVYNVELDFDLQHRRVTMRYERQGDPLSPIRLPLQERIEY